MLKRKAVSVFLVVLVSVLCPAACGLRATAAGDNASGPDCCGERHHKQDGPDNPAQPTDQSPDSCFCSTQGVTLEKADVSHLIVQHLPFNDDAQADASATFHLLFVTSHPLRFHPPDQQRVLPLLI